MIYPPSLGATPSPRFNQLSQQRNHLLATFPHLRDPGSVLPVDPKTTQDTGPIEQAPLATPVKHAQSHLRYLIYG